jgi:hypothetical protein
MKTHTTRMAVVAAMLISPALVFAQSAGLDDPNYPEKYQEPRRAEPLPVPQSGHDPQPPVATGVPPEGAQVIKQAGVGGEVAYGRSGVVELGGSASLTNASGLTAFALSPSVGWFFHDNLELSAIFGVSFSSVNGASSTFMTALVEPSYHVPFSKVVFGFLGLGMGLGYTTGAGAGFALAPRLGVNLLIGRSGILSPAAFFNYSTVGVTGNADAQVLQVRAAYGLQVGYTVML